MLVDSPALPELVAQLVREALEKGASVEIDGLGTFARDAKNRFTFHGKHGAKVFISYVHEDSAHAEHLFDAFLSHGFDPWLDRRKLLPGQNWPRAIQHAIETADFVVTCFSACAVRKKGGFQAEIRYALECAARVPMDEIFLIPLRLDACSIPAQIQNLYQYVDLFPDFDAGLRRIVGILKTECRKRGCK